MNDIAQLSTDSDELRKRFMDPCRLGSETDWWARRRIEELEQQLAASQQQAEFGKAFTGQFFLDIERLEQQLAEREKQVKLLRDYLMKLMLPVPHKDETAFSVAKAVSAIAEEALAATEPDDDRPLGTGRFG